MIPNEEIIKTLICETYARKNVVFLLFCVISFTLLAVGATWPKKYNAFTIIQVDETNILQSLMRGAAESTRAVDHEANAREIIFGEKIMQEVVNEPVWREETKGRKSDIQQERTKQYIKSNITIKNIGQNLLRIVYVDTNPERTYITAKRITELFIYEGEASKSKESKAAYDFINKQVNEYLDKLTKVEGDLREFRINNPDSRPGLEEETSRRITALENNIEQSKLELHEARIRWESIKKQLSGEAAITISHTRENQYRTKIAELQNKRDTLRLDYKETYPDIVRINHQVLALKHSLREEVERRKHIPETIKNHETYVDESININPLYNKLRNDAANTKIQISTLATRISDNKKILDEEYLRAKNIHEGKANLTNLTRDYEVNQEIYQDLLKRRENARVSKSIDQEQQGLNFEIQEPAKLPLIPTGLRFLHFVLAGLILGIIIPVGLIFIMLQIDPRIRFSQIISAELNVPVITEISKINTPQDIHKDHVSIFIIMTGFMVVLVIFGYVAWLKITGAFS